MAKTHRTLSDDQKAMLVAETLLPFSKVQDVADRHGVPANKISMMRTDYFNRVLNISTEADLEIRRKREIVYRVAASILSSEDLRTFQDFELSGSHRPYDAILANVPGEEGKAHARILGIRREVFNELTRVSAVAEEKRSDTILEWDPVDPGKRRKPYRVDIERYDYGRRGDLTIRGNMTRLMETLGVPMTEEVLNRNKAALSHIEEMARVHITLASGSASLRAQGVKAEIRIPGASIAYLADENEASELRDMPDIRFVVKHDGAITIPNGNGLSAEEMVLSERAVASGFLEQSAHDARTRYHEAMTAHLRAMFSRNIHGFQDSPFVQSRAERDLYEHVVQICGKRLVRENETAVRDYVRDQLQSIQKKNLSDIAFALNPDLADALRGVHLPRRSEDYLRVSEMAHPLAGALPMLREEFNAQLIGVRSNGTELDLSVLALELKKNPALVSQVLGGHLAPSKIGKDCDAAALIGVAPEMLEALNAASAKSPGSAIPESFNLAIHSRYLTPDNVPQSPADWQRFGRICLNAVRGSVPGGFSKEGLFAEIRARKIDWSKPIEVSVTFGEDENLYGYLNRIAPETINRSILSQIPVIPGRMTDGRIVTREDPDGEFDFA